MTKITVKSCAEKLKTDKYTIYEVTDVEGEKYDTNVFFKEGDVVECELVPDTSGKGYNPKLKLVKPNNRPFVVKDTKRETALLAACHNTVQMSASDVIERADEFYKWLNKK